MKKILILSMFCNSSPFIEEEQYLMETWAKPIIDGEYPGVSFYAYTASDDGKYHISYTEHIIKVPAPDDLRGTLEKTIKCLRMLDIIGEDYDYIFRTNTSTYINIPLLLNHINSIYNNNEIWAGNLFFCPEFAPTPYKGCMYAIGNALLLSKHHINVLLDIENINNTVNLMLQSDTVDNIYRFFIDDTIIGAILNNWFYTNNIQHHKMYHTFGLLHYEYSKRISPVNVIAIKCRSNDRSVELDRLYDINNRMQNEHPVNTFGMIDSYMEQDRIYYINISRGWKMEFVKRRKMITIMKKYNVPLI